MEQSGTVAVWGPRKRAGHRIQHRAMDAIENLFPLWAPGSSSSLKNVLTCTVSLRLRVQCEALDECFTFNFQPRSGPFVDHHHSTALHVLVQQLLDQMAWTCISVFSLRNQ